MSFRPGSRIFNSFRPMFRQPLLRRRVGNSAAPEQTGFAKFWNSKVGPKTVHFWAPIMKWSIVLAGAADLARPAEQLSLNTNFALMCTGAIWTRWCFVIRPQNLFLATVNFFLFLVGATQVTRITLWQRSVKNVETQAQTEGKVLEGELKDVAKKAEKAVKS
ncbi:UPF0041-domain-containing protein [Lentithecium fluviatile CBS 122367]|uniref:Mitochondrial pyruvate carrier n=1 Tax=Lentithecium fluviatile CBS 122367 TaxID=1168545 RepID=A0A6G1JH37_9PLEO|nr:UPF0041-domain-containing protein [Lentithecium fluviatile CBS 122367]